MSALAWRSVWIRAHLTNTNPHGNDRHRSARCGGVQSGRTSGGAHLGIGTPALRLDRRTAVRRSRRCPRAAPEHRLVGDRARTGRDLASGTADGREHRTASEVPMLVWWGGPELIQIFNDAFVPHSRRQISRRGRAARGGLLARDLARGRFPRRRGVGRPGHLHRERTAVPAAPRFRGGVVLDVLLQPDLRRHRSGGGGVRRHRRYDPRGAR